MNPLTKKLAIFLAISLGVNLLLGGFLIGRRFHAPPPGMHADHGRGPGLPHERARMMRGMGAQKAQFRALQAANAAARERAAAAFEHEPFDAAALDAALVALREDTARGQKALHEKLTERAKQGSPDDRRDLAKAFRRFPMRPE